jgi:hypothetical protein
MIEGVDPMLWERMRRFLRSRVLENVNEITDHRGGHTCFAASLKALTCASALEKLGDAGMLAATRQQLLDHGAPPRTLYNSEAAIKEGQVSRSLQEAVNAARGMT